MPLAYFSPAASGALFLAPDDGVVFGVPLRVAAAEIARGGCWPLWNPFLFGGMPLHGAAQAGLLFPLNWFYFAFPPAAATNLMALSTYALAGLGAYLYARRAAASVAGAFTTALVWQWSGFLVAQVGHTNIIQTASLLPWLLWAVDGYGAGGGGRRRGVVLAAIVALQVFAGHQQTLAYSLLLAAAYALAMARADAPRRDSYLWSVALIGAGLLLAAAQILPTYELMRHSLRATASYHFFTSFSLPPRFLPTLLAPYVVGGGDGRLFRAPYAGPAFYAEYIGYVGAGTLALAALARVLWGDARTKFWAVAAVVCLALALGRFWPFHLYGIVYYVPVLNLFRVPARHLMEVDFALAVLAGRGVTALAAAGDRARAARLALVAGACVLLLACLAVTWGRPADFRLGREAPLTILRAPELFLPPLVAALSAWALWAFARRRGHAATLILISVVALDLWLWGQSSGWRVSSPPRESGLWREPEAVRVLREREGQSRAPYRVLTVPQAFDPGGGSGPAGPAAGGDFVLALQPDVYMMHGIENAAGYDGFGLSRYSRLAGDMKLWGELSDPRRSLGEESREFDLLNVRYLLAKNGAARPGVKMPDAPPLAATEEFGGHLFAAGNLGAPEIKRGELLAFGAPRVASNSFALLSSLSWSGEVADGTEVARVRLRTQDGRTFEFALRAGEHTAEWAHDRPDIRDRIRHRRAPVATSYTAEGPAGNFEGHTYVAAFALPGRAVVTGGEIELATLPQSPQLGLTLFRATLSEGGAGNHVPLRAEWVTKGAAAARPEPVVAAPKEAPGRWRRVAETADVVVFENTRALPRAWLAPEAFVATEQQMLEAIRGGRLPGGGVWEPRRTALVEAPPGVPTGGGAAGEGRAEVTTHQPNHVVVSTSSEAPAILVLGDNHYPGWRAYVDGRPAETMRVNFNLRGVALAAGEHEVEFVYRPKSVLLGALVSLLAAALLALWCLRLLPEARARRLLARLGRGYNSLPLHAAAPEATTGPEGAAGSSHARQGGVSN